MSMFLYQVGNRRDLGTTLPAPCSLPDRPLFPDYGPRVCSQYVDVHETWQTNQNIAYHG